MDQIVLCDTNAVIQLAIISQKVFAQNDYFELVVNQDVFDELNNLLQYPEKDQRLGTHIRWIQNNVPVNNSYMLPTDWEDIDETYQCQEMAMFGHQKSSPTSPKDRKFLIIADANNIILLTREKTLYNLSRNIIGIERSYSISSFLFNCTEWSILTATEIQTGVRSLLGHKETLPEDCIKNLKDIGIKYP
jgi:hypothetical protein